MTELLTTVAILFIVAGPFLLVANRFDLPAVPLLIVAGVLAGFLVDEETALELAQYGIALLVFGFGAKLRLSNVRAVLVDGEVAALGQIVVLGTLGVVLGAGLGLPLEEAIYVGVAASLSSTIVGTALMGTAVRPDLVRARLAQSIHFFQDLLAIAFVLMVGAATIAPVPIATELAAGAVLLAGAVLVNRYLFDTTARLAGDSVELLILAVVSLIVVFVGAAQALEVSIVVGAFAAGLAVRHDPVEHIGLYSGLESIEDFFVAIFFLTVGALVTLPFVGDIGWTASVEKVTLAAGLVALTAVAKPAITAAILLWRGYGPRTATLSSLNTDQVSEFALIVAIEALLIGLLTQDVFDAIILATAVTMVTSSLTHRYEEAIYRWLSERDVLPTGHTRIDAWSEVPADLDDHVVVVGYGRHGRRLVESCEDLDRPYVVIENDPARRESVTDTCAAFVLGDAMEHYTLEKANVEDARIVISTVDKELLSRRLLSVADDADVVLLTGSVTTAFDLLDSGALHVAVPDLLAGEQLVGHLRRLLEGEMTPEELRESTRASIDDAVVRDGP